MSEKQDKNWVEELEVNSGNLVAKVQELLRDSSATRVIICKPSGEEIISVPLTIGVLVGGVLTLALPRLAAIGAVGGMIAQFKLKVERRSDGTVQTVTHEEDLKDSTPPTV